MAGERKLKVEILGDASSLKDAFGDAEKGGDKFESGMAKLGGKLKLGLAAAGVAGGAAAVTGFKGALESEAAKANLGASLGLNRFRQGRRHCRQPLCRQLRCVRGRRR